VKVELRDIQAVRPYEQNPRVNDQAVEAVVKSLREFGFRQPIVVDADSVIIVGHTRYKAALRLGLKQVPVHVATDLTPAQVKAYRLADNQTATLAEWNYDLLPLELKDLRGMDFDFSLLGFSAEDLGALLAPPGNEGLTDPDAVPAPPDEATTKPGDLWILGNHRLLCGDSSSIADVDRLLGGAPIHLVNTDPPYNVKVEPRSNNAIAAGLSSFPGDDLQQKKLLNKTCRAETAHGGLMHHQSFDVARQGTKHATTEKLRPKDRPLANDFVSDEAFDKMLRAWFGNIARVLVPGRCFYIWGGYANCGNYPPALKECGLYFSQAVIWVKEHPVLTRKDFMGNHEWCQPPDTSVLTPSGSASIQSLRDGDRVVSFSRHSPAIVGLRDGLEVKVTSRHYAGPLYGVAVDDRSTWSTDGHIWSVRMTPAAKSKWCIYLMQRGNWWRVGRCKLCTTWGLGLKQRLMMEGGEAAWILGVYDDKDDATLAEQIVSTGYGIPTTFWNETRASRRTEAMVRRIYDCLDPDDMERSARRAMTDHGRSVFHPFIARGHTGQKHGPRASLLVRACNLLPGAMAVPVPRGGQSVEWVPVRAVDVQSYSGTVHSMAVNKHYHYIADGIVTHNCFYGWREGAGHEFFGPNNATDVWSVKKVNPASMIHLTEKPVELAVRAIEYSSRPGENVLDLFGGSGSTLIACEKTGRRAYLMELDALYCDVIVKRYEQFTDTKATMGSARE